jgi:hypothetical protein
VASTEEPNLTGATQRAQGIEAHEDEICMPVESAIACLRTMRPRMTRIALLGTPSLCAKFERAGVPSAQVPAGEATIEQVRRPDEAGVNDVNPEYVWKGVLWLYRIATLSHY